MRLLFKSLPAWLLVVLVGCPAPPAQLTVEEYIGQGITDTVTPIDTGDDDESMPEEMLSLSL